MTYIECLGFQYSRSKDVSQAHLLWKHVCICQVLQCLLLPASFSSNVAYNGLTFSNHDQDKEVAEQTVLIHNGCLFAFVGGLAIGKLNDAFKPLGTVTPLQVVSVLPMEWTTENSYISLSSVCVHGLSSWLDNNFHVSDHRMWLGWSLGALVASAAALICETALAQPGVLIVLDCRWHFPLRHVGEKKLRSSFT